MKQFYATIWEMEDVENGMYSNKINKMQIEKSKNLLANINKFNDTIDLVFKNWKVSTAVNLSNKSINRKAWIGQASCLFLCKSNEKETKTAWFQLSDEQREMANKIAELKIKQFEAIWNGKLSSISKLGNKDVMSMESQMKLNLEWKN
jgi:hypothetical protein